ncbi:MAG: PKD domain-containing protein [Solirubrobacteraceae bacterium]
MLSSPSLGPTDAAQGLVAGGDVAGDAAVAWVQGDPGQEAIVAAQLFKAPGSFVPEYRFVYSRTSSPTLSWTAANELWGSPQYNVAIDGVAVGQTTGLTYVPPAPLLNGRHSYQVTAVNAAGVATAARPAVVFVDTVAPQVTYRLQGLRAIGLAERLSVHYRDLPPAGLPPSAASGVATVFVRWGDGTVQRIRRNNVSHVYRRARRYTITITATDRAGNQTVKRIAIVIRKQPPKKHHRRGRSHKRHSRRQHRRRG